jgi:hypothetical protein
LYLSFCLITVENKGEKKNIGPRVMKLYMKKSNIHFHRYFGIATSWTAGVRFLARTRNFSLVHSVQTGFGVQPASFPMGSGGFFTGGKAAEVSPSSAEIKNGGAIPALPYKS